MEKQQVHQSQGNKMKDNHPKIENKNTKMNVENKVEKTEDIKQEKDVKKTEEKPKVEKTHNKKNYAIVNGKDLPISTKHSIAICNFIRYKNIEESIQKLEQVKNKKLPLPMRGEIPHKKGKGIMSARYPKNASEHFIKLLRSLMANAITNELELEKYKIECYSNVAPRPYRRFGRGRFKRSHVTIKLTPITNKTQ